MCLFLISFPFILHAENTNPIFLNAKLIFRLKNQTELAYIEQLLYELSDLGLLFAKGVSIGEPVKSLFDSLISTEI